MEYRLRLFCVPHNEVYKCSQLVCTGDFTSEICEFGEPPGNRTPNLLIKSQLLCQLS